MNERNEIRDDEPLAAVDLGSNSFHMLIAELVEGELRPLQRFREKVRLADFSAMTAIAAVAVLAGLAMMTRLVAGVGTANDAMREAMKQVAASNESIAKAMAEAVRREVIAEVSMAYHELLLATK